jgi:glucokinase
MMIFDFGGTKVEVALVGPARQIINGTTLPTEAENGADQVIERALSAAGELCTANGVVGVSSVGVSTMGYTREDGVDLAPNVPGWECLKLPATFRSAFPGVPLMIENDVRAAAIAELRWGALAGVTTGIYLNFGTGVAATVIVEGKPVVGSHGVAGEIGYWLLQGRGNSSTLEEQVGGAGVRSRALSIGIDGSLAELLASTDSRAGTIVDEIFVMIAMSVTNIAVLLDPERIVLGGGFTRTGDRLLSVVRDELQRRSRFPPELTIGHFGSGASLYGAIALAEAAREDSTGVGAP